MDKKRVRQHALRLRRGLSDQTAASCGRAIIDRLFQSIDWSSVRRVHIYTAIPGEHEVDASLLVSRVTELFPYISIATWRDFRSGFDSVWLSGEYQGSAVDPGVLFDVIIVPVVAFNDDLFRIGFGAGFYDRFLVNQPQAKKIGPSYDISRHPFIPESHDIPLDAIVTESGLLGTRGFE